MFEIFLGVLLTISADGSTLFHGSNTYESEAACVRDVRAAVEDAQAEGRMIHTAVCESFVFEVPEPA